MALQIVAVANSIAALSVSNLVIKDLDEVPNAASQRTATLMPLHAYISEMDVVRDSVGGGSSADFTVSYVLNYRLLYSFVGEGRTITSEFPGLVAMIAAIWDAVIAIDTFTGGIDIAPLSPTAIGIVQDPSNFEFYGCDLAFRVMEFVN